MAVSACLKYISFTILWSRSSANVDCAVDECWCVSRGGSTCQGTGGSCVSNTCKGRTVCTGGGYWCEDEGPKINCLDNSSYLDPKNGSTCVTEPTPTSPRAFGSSGVLKLAMHVQGATLAVEEQGLLAWWDDLRKNRGAKITAANGASFHVDVAIYNISDLGFGVTDYAENIHAFREHVNILIENGVHGLVDCSAIMMNAMQILNVNLPSVHCTDLVEDCTDSRGVHCVDKLNMPRWRFSTRDEPTVQVQALLHQIIHAFSRRQGQTTGIDYRRDAKQRAQKLLRQELSDAEEHVMPSWKKTLDPAFAILVDQSNHVSEIQARAIDLFLRPYRFLYTRWDLPISTSDKLAREIGSASFECNTTRPQTSCSNLEGSCTLLNATASSQQLLSEAAFCSNKRQAAIDNFLKNVSAEGFNVLLCLDRLTSSWVIEAIFRLQINFAAVWVPPEIPSISFALGNGARLRAEDYFLTTQAWDVHAKRYDAVYSSPADFANSLNLRGRDAYRKGLGAKAPYVVEAAMRTITRWQHLTDPERREELALAISWLDLTDSVYGRLAFNRRGFLVQDFDTQLVLQHFDGKLSVVLPRNEASTDFTFFIPTWEARLYTCPAGSENKQQTMCQPCDMHMYSPFIIQNASSASNRSCQPCPLGTGTTNRGFSECTACAPGFYAPRHRTGCIRCREGKVCDKFGCSKCEQCMPGRYSNASINCVNCPQGHYQVTPTSSCLVCPAGRFSRIPNGGAMFCSECPELKLMNGTVLKMICPGGATMPTAEAGTFCTGNDCETQFECSPKKACLKNGRCSQGQTGFACADCVCQAGDCWARASDDALCTPCGDNTRRVVQFVGLCCMLFFYWYTVAMTLRAKGRKGSAATAILLKIALNHINFMAAILGTHEFDFMKGGHGEGDHDHDISHHLPLKGTRMAFGILDAGGITDANSMLGLPMYCVLGPLSPINITYFNVIIGLLVPIIALVVLLTAHSMRLLLLGGTQTHQERLSLSIACLYVQYVFTLKCLRRPLLCKESFGRWALLDSGATECKDPDGYTYRALATCGLLFYGVGFPLAYAFIVRHFKKKMTLSFPRTKALCGFLYTGFEPDKYYWESVKMCQKLLVLVVGTVRHKEMALAIWLFLFLSFLMLHLWSRPYDDREYGLLDKMESRSMYAMCTTLITLVMQQDLHRWTRFSYAWQLELICVSLAVSVNSVFFLSIAWNLSRRRVRDNVDSVVADSSVTDLLTERSFEFSENCISLRGLRATERAFLAEAIGDALRVLVVEYHEQIPVISGSILNRVIKVTARATYRKLDMAADKEIQYMKHRHTGIHEPKMQKVWQKSIGNKEAPMTSSFFKRTFLKHNTGLVNALDNSKTKVSQDVLQSRRNFQEADQEIRGFCKPNEYYCNGLTILFTEHRYLQQLFQGKPRVQFFDAACQTGDDSDEGDQAHDDDVFAVPVAAENEGPSSSQPASKIVQPLQENEKPEKCPIEDLKAPRRPKVRVRWQIPDSPDHVQREPDQCTCQHNVHEPSASRGNDSTCASESSKQLVHPTNAPILASETTERAVALTQFVSVALQDSLTAGAPRETPQASEPEQEPATDDYSSRACVAFSNGTVEQVTACLASSNKNDEHLMACLPSSNEHVEQVTARLGLHDSPTSAPVLFSISQVTAFADMEAQGVQRVVDEVAELRLQRRNFTWAQQSADCAPEQSRGAIAPVEVVRRSLREHAPVEETPARSKNTILAMADL